MAAFRLNLRIDQGATFNKIVTWSAGTPSAPVNLTGCSARMMVRLDIDDPAPVLTLTTVGGGIVLGGAAGTVQLLLSAAATLALTWEAAVYDLEITFADGVTVRRLLQGSITVSPTATY